MKKLRSILVVVKRGFYTFVTYLYFYSPQPPSTPPSLPTRMTGIVGTEEDDPDA